MEESQKPKSTSKSQNKSAKPKKEDSSMKADENSKGLSINEQENYSQTQDHESQDDNRFKTKSQKSGTDQPEGSEMNDKMEEEKSGDDDDDMASVESLEQKKRQFNFSKLKSWELQPVKIANVWDFMPDLVVYKWVKVRESDNTIQRKERDRPQVYKCKHEECGKVFPDQSSRKKHMLTHGERMFLCPYEGCGKKFLDNSKLKRHYLVHTGEKNYKCDICGKLFSLDFNLRTHMRTHTGEKPYICKFPGCAKRFTQSSNLSAHEKNHLANISKDAPAKGAKPKTVNLL